MKTQFSESVEHALLLNGWHPTRSINIRPFYWALKSRGYQVHQNAVRFFKQFGGLVLNKKTYIDKTLVNANFYSDSIGFGVDPNGKNFFSNLELVLWKMRLIDTLDWETRVCQSIRKRFNQIACIIGRDYRDVGVNEFLIKPLSSCKCSVSSFFFPRKYSRIDMYHNIYMLENGVVIKDCSRCSNTMFLYHTLDWFLKDFFKLLPSDYDDMIELLDISEFDDI